MFENHPGDFAKVLKAMAARVPGVSEVKAVQTADGRIVLNFRDGMFKDPFVSRFVSDGTIKMFAYLVLLYDPKPHPLLCAEEPENQLYASLLADLSEEFRSYANRGGQVFVSTHSPDFLSSVPLDSIFILAKQEGYTTVRRAADNENLRAFVYGGETPGALWRQGLFAGADPARDRRSSFSKSDPLKLLCQRFRGDLDLTRRRLLFATKASLTLIDLFPTKFEIGPIPCRPAS